MACVADGMQWARISMGIILLLLHCLLSYPDFSIVLLIKFQICFVKGVVRVAL